MFIAVLCYYINNSIKSWNTRPCSLATAGRTRRTLCQKVRKRRLVHSAGRILVSWRCGWRSRESAVGLTRNRSAMKVSLPILLMALNTPNLSLFASLTRCVVPLLVFCVIFKSLVTICATVTISIDVECWVHAFVCSTLTQRTVKWNFALLPYRWNCHLLSLLWARAASGRLLMWVMTLTLPYATVIWQLKPNFFMFVVN